MRLPSLLEEGEREYTTAMPEPAMSATPPLQGVKTTGVNRKGNAIRTCSSFTKNWVTHADRDCLKLENNAGNYKPGWESYCM